MVQCSDASCQVDLEYRNEGLQTDSPSVYLDSSSQTTKEELSIQWSQTSFNLDITPSVKPIPSLDSYKISFNIDTTPHTADESTQTTLISESVNYLPFNVERIPFDPNNLGNLFERVKKVTSGSSPDTEAFVDSSFDSTHLKNTSENSPRQTAEAIKIFGSTSFIYEDENDSQDFDMDYIRSATNSSLKLTAETINAFQGGGEEESVIAEMRRVTGRSLLRTAETVEYYYSGTGGLEEEHRSK
jgi:hypothetical protein